VDEVIINAIVCLEQDQLASSGGVELFECSSSNEGAEERPPEDLSWEVGADFLEDS
jgi:hypothetical protein